MKDYKIKIENNYDEIMKYLEEYGYKWNSGALPTELYRDDQPQSIDVGEISNGAYRIVSSYSKLDSIPFDEFKDAHNEWLSELLAKYDDSLDTVLNESEDIDESTDTRMTFIEGLFNGMKMVALHKDDVETYQVAVYGLKKYKLMISDLQMLLDLYDLMSPFIEQYAKPS